MLLTHFSQREPDTARDVHEAAAVFPGVNGAEDGMRIPCRGSDRDRRMTEFEELVLAVIEDLLPGEVVSYGWVAGEAGRPGAARAVGRILRDIADEPTPWWRVVRSDGRIVSPNAVKRREMLQNEGVVLHGDRVIRPRPASRRR